MKRLLLIGIAVLLAMASCQSPTRKARQMVKRAERLADTLPDSAAHLIDSVLRIPAHFTERERMEMALLQAEALFGNRDVSGSVSTLMDDDYFDTHANLSTSPELERAAAYYARKKQYGKAGHAALYSGFVQQHYNEKEAAMQSFKDAVQYGSLDGDSLTVALAQYRMGKMLLDDGIEQEALKSFAVSENNIGNRYADLATIENSKAVAYILMRQNDSAELCLRQGVLYAEKGNSGRVKHKLYNNYSVLYRLQDKYDQAIASLRQAMDGTGLDDAERLVLYLNLGNVYFKMHEMDSAARYFQCMEALLPVVNVKKETMVSAYEVLSQFAESQSNASLALQYREKHERVLYDLMIQRQTQSIYRIQQQYDYESLQNVMNRKIIQRHRIILIVCILLIVATCIILILLYRHKQLLKSEQEMKRQLDALKQDLRQTVNPTVLDNEISSRLRMIISAYQISKSVSDPKKVWNPLVMKIMNGEDDPFEAARSVLEAIYPRLYATINENYPDLTETEARICLLSCSDISNAEIADILGLKTSTVNQNRSNLRKKLNLNPDKMKEQLRMALSE